MFTSKMYRSDDEWFQLITACRQNGRSDKEWCELNSIPLSTFYNAVTRLRKKACSIPEHSKTPVMDLTSRKQDVVQIDIVPDMVIQTAGSRSGELPAAHLDNLHTIEILFQNGCSLRISNPADPVLLEKVVAIIGKSLC
mgnify:FL=1